MSNTEKRVFHLVHDLAVQNAANAVRDPHYAGCKVTIEPPAKTRLQEERYHAMIGDIAAQFELHGRRWDPESMKRLLVDQFRRDTMHDPEFARLWASMGTMEMAPSIDGTGLVALGWQTRRFPKKLASAFIEWLFAFGAEVEIHWSNERRPEAVAA